MRRVTAGTLVALAVTVVGAGAVASPGQGPTLRIVVRGQGRVRCGTRCSGAHRRGAVVRLSAEPAANYEFVRWAGGCIGLVPTCPIELDRDTAVSAYFVGQPTEVLVAVGGPGGVTSSPVGLDCGHGGYLCTIEVPFGSRLTLVPHPEDGGRFAGWDGSCATAGPRECTLRVDSFPTDTAAAFGHTSPLSGDQPLTVSLDFSGPHVTSQPVGIDCPPACTASFASGTVVTLHRDDNGRFGGSCVRTELDRCAVVVDEPTVVGIGPPPPPDEVPPPTSVIQLTVSGPGLVTSSDGRIGCGRLHGPKSRCSEYVSPGGGTIVRLRPRAQPHARFVRWAGYGSCATRRICSLQPYGESQYQVNAVFRRTSP